MHGRSEERCEQEDLSSAKNEAWEEFQPQDMRHEGRRSGRGEDDEAERTGLQSRRLSVVS